MEGGRASPALGANGDDSSLARRCRPHYSVFNIRKRFLRQYGFLPHHDDVSKRRRAMK